LLKDLEQSPGGLPLLQYTLTELWQRQQDNQLKLSVYHQLGGVAGTLKQRADKVYSLLTPEQQLTAKHIFLSLTQPGEETEDTRRRITQGSLLSSQHPESQITQVVKRLADANLVITDKRGEYTATVDVAHEALIRNWPQLRQWLDESRDLLRKQRKIDLVAKEWNSQQRKPGYLLQGLLLDEAIQFRKQQADILPLSDLTREYIRKSRRHRYWNRLKAASILLVVVPIVDYSLHRNKIEQHYNNLNGADQGEERKSALFLTQDCIHDRPTTGYLQERFTSRYCRSLGL
jgi:hypothetical protein